MLVDLRLDHSGIASILKSGPFAANVAEKAAEIASGVVGQIGGRFPVEVSTYTTDRAAAAVTIAHPAGAILQARDGVLTRAAAAAGLEVTERG